MALFSASLVIVFLLVVLIGWNLTSGFNRFVEETEKQRFNEVILQLTDYYKGEGSWDALYEDKRQWHKLVDPKFTSWKNLPEEGSRPEGRPPHHGHRPPRGEPPRGKKPPRPRHGGPPPGGPNHDPEARQTGARISLYDIDKDVIIGRYHFSENYHNESIELDGEVIAWLGLAPSKANENSPANEFLRQQYEMFYIIAAVVTLIALLIAALLSNHLVLPIKKLIAGSNQLTSGDYSQRIKNPGKDEIAILSENLDELAYTLEKNQQQRFQWTSDISHELRTPLTVVKSQLEAIKDGVLHTSEDRIDLFLNEINKLSRLVDDLYQLSSSDIGALNYKKEMLNPAKLLQTSIENHRLRFTEKSISINNELDNDLDCELAADKDRLLQLFSNVLENAYRYTNEGGRLKISGTVNGFSLKLRLEDSAPGVAPDEIPKLFDRLYRVETSRHRDYGGAGLGLALCKQIVEAHNGHLTAESSALGGIAINIELKLTFLKS